MEDEEKAKAKAAQFIATLDRAVSSCRSSVCQYFTVYALRAAAQKGEEELKSLVMQAAKLEARDAALSDIAARLRAEEN